MKAVSLVVLSALTLASSAFASERFTDLNKEATVMANALQNGEDAKGGSCKMTVRFVNHGIYAEIDTEQTGVVGFIVDQSDDLDLEAHDETDGSYSHTYKTPTGSITFVNADDAYYYAEMTADKTTVRCGVYF
jgi:hypothetical protein